MDRCGMVVFPTISKSVLATQRSPKRLAAHVRRRFSTIHVFKTKANSAGWNSEGIGEFTVAQDFVKICETNPGKSCEQPENAMRPAEYVPHLRTSFRLREDLTEHGSHFFDWRKRGGVLKLLTVGRVAGRKLSIFVDTQPENVIVSVKGGERGAR